MKTKLILFLIICFAFLVGIFVSPHREGTPSTITSMGQDSSHYPLLAKRLFIEDPNEPIVAFSRLRTQLNDYFTTNSLSGSLYFEYLPTGTSIRIGTDQKRVAASLIKLPFAMEAYYARDNSLISFDTQVTITNEMLDSNFGELYKRGAGAQISLGDALDLMLKDSDNTALNVVTSQVEGVVSPENGVFNFLDAEFVQNEDYTVSLTPRAYSSFLKCLYFSCYLNKDSSQEILTKLAESHIKDRLPAGISGTTTVAHKVGNYFDQVQSDCGIVYIPKRNYVICVMLDGPDNPETSRKIAALSKLAYDYVASYK